MEKIGTGSLRDNGKNRSRGCVTSPPFAKIVRIEVEQGSPLPVQLEKAGHRLHHAGMTTRIDGGAFHTVDVLELDLGR